MNYLCNIVWCMYVLYKCGRALNIVSYFVWATHIQHVS